MVSKKSRSKGETQIIKIEGKYSQLIFECAICARIYNKPGICDICKVTLKPKGG
ncbi:MAG: hypothetical protein QXQ18_02085 [Candidatus Aenigmatarchaeota archaeon]